MGFLENMGKHLVKHFAHFATICEHLRLTYPFSQPPALPIPTAFPLLYMVSPKTYKVEVEGIEREFVDTP